MSIMKRANDPEYNIDWEGEKKFNSVTIDELIEALQTAKEVLGGNCIVMMSYDGSAGYDNIRTLHGENLHNELICTLSCCSHIDNIEPINEDKIKLFCHAFT